MNDKLEKILKLVESTPVKFKTFSNDTQQINPKARVTSIINILGEIQLPINNSTIVDIGTGYGYGAILLNSLGYNVIGIESNKDKLYEGLKYWRRLGFNFTLINKLSDELRHNRNLYFLPRDARNLEDFPDNSIEMVTAFYISGYMLGKDKAFREVGRILKPGSHFILSTQGPTSVPHLLRGLAVKILTSLYIPNDLRHYKTVKINNPNVYDNYIITMVK